MKILLAIVFMLTSCSNPVVSSSPTTSIALSNFPIMPNVVPYQKDPIISTINDDFVVSSDFVGNSIKLKKYVDKINAWKQLNSIK